jgi:hypothetical protein
VFKKFKIILKKNIFQINLDYFFDFLKKESKQQENTKKKKTKKIAKENIPTLVGAWPN